MGVKCIELRQYLEIDSPLLCGSLHELMGSMRIVGSNLGIGLAIGVALALRLFATVLDPYLNTWDECFHALVGKNMSVRPFTPMLFTQGALLLDDRNWTQGHFWLHKQPFFLWCMALSIKLFGNTVFAVRLPSVLFTTALVYFTYDIARVVHGRKAAFAAAMLMACSHWVLMLLVGQIMTDHNDAIFISLVGASLWAWCTMEERSDRWNVLLIGGAAGLAVLTKWLPGVLVFAAWGVVLLVHGKERRWGGVFLRSIAVTVLIALPWQVYAWLRFPELMAHEMALNTRHLFEAVEGHEGGRDFHFSSMDVNFHPFGPWTFPIIVLLGLSLIREGPRRTFALAAVIGVFVFYTLVPTKMPSFPMLVLPLLLVGVAGVLQRVVEGLPTRWANPAFLTVLLPLCIAMVQWERIQFTHGARVAEEPFYSVYRSTHLHNRRAMEELDRLTRELPHPLVVFNVPFPANISHSFFHDVEALPGAPSREQLRALKAAGVAVVVVDPDSAMRERMPPHVHVVNMGGQGFVQEPI